MTSPGDKVDKLDFEVFLLNTVKINPERYEEILAAHQRTVKEAVRAERKEEAGLWLDMVVREEKSRLDSNEWYKLDPKVVSKFWAQRLAELEEE